MALTVKVGSAYVLTESIGSGVGAVPAGTRVVVESVSKKHVPGAAGELLLSFQTDAGTTRHVAMARADFIRKFKAGK